MPAGPSSPIPAVLANLEPLAPHRVADLCPYLDSVPDPRSRRGRWYTLAGDPAHLRPRDRLEREKL